MNPDPMTANIHCELTTQDTSYFDRKNDALA